MHAMNRPSRERTSALSGDPRRGRRRHRRMGVYVALGASAGSLPLPWLPEALLRHVRGALAHDLASRHGLSLTPEARDALSELSRGHGSGASVLRRLVRFLGVRLVVRVLTRFGPVWMVWPLWNALSTFALGHLFERYLASGRGERAGRIDLDEARRVRRAIDGAVARALSVQAPRAEPREVIDDERDAWTTLFDRLSGLAAEIPNWLVRRLETAFEELLAAGHE